jgi:hypothetical protein
MEGPVFASCVIGPIEAGKLVPGRVFNLPFWGKHAKRLLFPSPQFPV